MIPQFFCGVKMWNAKGKSTLFGVLFLSSLLVKARVYVVDIFLVQAVFGEAQAFAEALEVYDLARTQEFDDITHVRIVGKAQDIVVRHARFLLCCDRVRTTFQMSNCV